MGVILKCNFYPKTRGRGSTEGGGVGLVGRGWYVAHRAVGGVDCVSYNHL